MTAIELNNRKDGAVASRTVTGPRVGPLVAGAIVLLFIVVFLVWPVATVAWVAFTEKGSGRRRPRGRSRVQCVSRWVVELASQM